jgi:hypothetical protein
MRAIALQERIGGFAARMMHEGRAPLHLDIDDNAALWTYRLRFQQGANRGRFERTMGRHGEHYARARHVEF